MKKYLFFVFLVCSVSSYSHDIVTSLLPKLCGVEFGSSYKYAESVLESKFGKKSILSDETEMYFDGVFYGGFYWQSIRFFFQKGEYRDFLCRVLFIGLKTKDIEDVKSDRDSYYKKLKDSYPNLVPKIDDNGFKFYIGGPDILRNTSIGTENLGPLICIDVIKIEDEYCARIDYGIVPFVNENF